MTECDCGKWYEGNGAELCAANGHGNGADEWNARQRFVNTVEVEYIVLCCECSAPLRASIHIDKSAIELRVMPHVCPVDSLE